MAHVLEHQFQNRRKLAAQLLGTDGSELDSVPGYQVSIYIHYIEHLYLSDIPRELLSIAYTTTCLAKQRNLGIYQEMGVN